MAKKMNQAERVFAMIDQEKVREYVSKHTLYPVVLLGGTRIGNEETVQYRCYMLSQVDDYDYGTFFVFYPCLLCGIIPVNLLGYDERSRWMQYSGTLPYSKTQIVSSKYLIGLFAQTAMLIVIGIAQGIRMNMNGGFRFDDFIVLILMLLIIFTVTSSISLPFIFKLGVEKGRIAYYIMVGVLCGGSVAASRLFSADLLSQIQSNNFLAILCFAGIGIYAFSWYLSIVFYKKREIQ